MAVVQNQVAESPMTNDFNLGGKEYKTKNAPLIPIGGKLPYYLEIQTAKLLDVLLTYFGNHPNLPSNRQQARTKINGWLYARTRLGFYQQFGDHLHLAYAHQKDGHRSQHYWRLFFDQTNKKAIENLVNGFNLIFSAVKFPGYQAHLRRLDEEGGGYWYRVDSLQMEGWLCPALFKYFPEAPENIYVQCS